MNLCNGLIIFLSIISVVVSIDDLETVISTIELLEMDLNDKHDLVVETRKNLFLNKENTLKKKLQIQKEYGLFLKNQSIHLKTKFSNIISDAKPSLLRKWDILTHMGDIEMDENDFNKLLTFDFDVEELWFGFNSSCDNSKDCIIRNLNNVNKLSTSRNITELEQTWVQLNEPLSLKTENEYVSVLQLVNKAAGLNGFNNFQTYWETLSDYPNVYLEVKSLWDEIEPFYKKFHTFVKSRIENKFKYESQSIPVFLLGSEFGTDWSNVADVILPHKYLYDEILSVLEHENVRGKKMYEVATNLTLDMGFGKVGKLFWQESKFNEMCPSQLFSYDSDCYSQVITCNNISWNEYLNAHEHMVKATLENFDLVSNTYRAFRMSALDEAVVSLSADLAIKNLPLANLVPQDIILSKDNQMTALLMTALRVLPKLPYYYLVDVWRMQLLKDPSQDATSLWWKLRESIQGVKGSTNKEHDYLADPFIRTNKPYISKFLGNILQFQLLEHFENDADESSNILTHISKDSYFKAMLKKRSEDNWMSLLKDELSIYELSADALLTYFKPLEVYFDSAPTKQVTQTVIPKTTTTQMTKPTTKMPPVPTDKPLSDDVVANEMTLKPEVSTVTRNIKEVPVKESKKQKHLDTKPSKEPDSDHQMTIVYIGVAVALAVVISVVIGTTVYVKKFRRKRNTRNRRYET